MSTLLLLALLALIPILSVRLAVWWYRGEVNGDRVLRDALVILEAERGEAL